MGKICEEQDTSLWRSFKYENEVSVLLLQNICNVQNNSITFLTRRNLQNISATFYLALI